MNRESTEAAAESNKTMNKIQAIALAVITTSSIALGRPVDAPAAWKAPGTGSYIHGNSSGGSDYTRQAIKSRTSVRPNPGGAHVGSPGRGEQFLRPQKTSFNASRGVQAKMPRLVTTYKVLSFSQGIVFGLGQKPVTESDKQKTRNAVRAEWMKRCRDESSIEPKDQWDYLRNPRKSRAFSGESCGVPFVLELPKSHAQRPSKTRHGNPLSL